MTANGNTAPYRWAIGLLLTVVIFGIGVYVGNYSIAAEFSDYKSKVAVNTSRIDTLESGLKNIDGKLDRLLERE